MELLMIPLSFTGLPNWYIVPVLIIFGLMFAADKNRDE